MKVKLLQHLQCCVQEDHAKVSMHRNTKVLNREKVRRRIRIDAISRSSAIKKQGENSPSGKKKKPQTPSDTKMMASSGPVAILPLDMFAQAIGAQGSRGNGDASVQLVTATDYKKTEPKQAHTKITNILKTNVSR